MGDTRHFTRDTTLASDIADQFGGGAGNAENLVEANALRYSPELTAAQLATGRSVEQDPDELQFTKADVAKESGLDEEDILSFDLHGDTVIYLFETPDGRVHKDVLLHDEGDLTAPEDHDSPARAAVRAQAAAASKVKDARVEAEDILAQARAEADKIVADAAAKAEEDRQEKVEEASAKQAEKADEDRKAAEEAEAKRTATSKPAPKGQGKQAK